MWKTLEGLQHIDCTFPLPLATYFKLFHSIAFCCSSIIDFSQHCSLLWHFQSWYIRGGAKRVTPTLSKTVCFSLSILLFLFYIYCFKLYIINISWARGPSDVRWLWKTWCDWVKIFRIFAAAFSLHTTGCLSSFYPACCLLCACGWKFCLCSEIGQLWQRFDTRTRTWRRV